jgi:glutamate synthase domain-containing protein 3
MTTAVAQARTLDLGAEGSRAVNAALQSATAGERFRLLGPAGSHNVAVGLTVPIEVEVAGAVGYYAAGMNEAAIVRIQGDGGVGVAENMMSGRVDVVGNAGAAAAATAHGGLLTIAGDAGARCGISLKGADVVIAGRVGHSCGFMAQSGRVVICGDAGEGLGDSIYETRIYLGGEVASLGADCVEKPMRAEHVEELVGLLAAADIETDPGDFRRFGSARKLYHFEPEGSD